MQKRGYFFVLDSIIALVVLGVGTFLIFTVFSSAPSEQEAAILSEDVMDFLANNQIKDVDNEYAGIGGTLWTLGEITNAENTLLQQAGEFYENGKLIIANTFIQELTEDSFPDNYLFEFWINNQLIYPDTELVASKDATDVLIPSRKMVFGIIDKETGDMFGPYTAEVLVWQG